MTKALSLLIAAGVSAGTALAQEAPARNITFNGRQLSAADMRKVGMLERLYRVRLADGDYWYDNRSGAIGLWNGPTAGAIMPGLQLGGAMPANCSGGGTGVFVNGRELHPFDVAVLSNLGTVYRGRYWVDAYGNFGFEGGLALGNLFRMQSAAVNPGPHRVYKPGELSGLIRQ